MRVFRFLPHRISYLLACAAGLAGSDASAQRLESTVDIGGVAIQYADTLNGVAATITPHFSADWGNRIAEASSTYSQFGSNWSLQGQANASLFVPIIGLVGELGAFAGGSTHRDGSGTGEVLVNARLHAQQRWAEWFVGGGAGRTAFAGTSRTVLLGEAGVSRSIADANVTLSVTPVAMGDSIRYADGQLSVSQERGRLELAAVAGGRVGDQLQSLGGTTRVWGNVSATAWLKPRLALVVGGGNYPIDPTQGFPGGRYVSLGFRLSQSARVVATEIPAAVGAGDVAVAKFEVEESPGSVTFRVLAPRAHSVEIAGDFSSWDPIQLSPAGNGWWITTRTLLPGKYQMNLRIDGGKWSAPPGLLGMLDEFGGAVGLLVVQ